MITLIYYAHDNNNEKDLIIFNEIASNDNHINFGIVLDTDISKRSGIEKSKLVLYKDFDYPKVLYKDKFEKKEILQFL